MKAKLPGKPKNEVMDKRLYCLSQYIQQARKQGVLSEIDCSCDPHLEMAEVAQRVAKASVAGRVLLFTCPTSSGGNGEVGEVNGFPVVMNMYSSRERMLEILRASSYEAVARRLEQLLVEGTKPRYSLRDKLRGAKALLGMARYMPRRYRGYPPCQDVRMDNPSLDKLPILQTWPADGGRFFTLPMVITQHPTTGVRNVGMYRMQVLDGLTTGMHWHTHKTGANHFRAYAERGERMPVCVALGGDPLLAYCATAPLPEGMDEWLLAGFLRRDPVRLVKALTCDLLVPAEADFIIEGYVDPQEEQFLEGPFGDHTGFYSLEDWYPRFHITCISHRREAVYPATVVGVPPMEDAYIAEATEQIFKPLLRMGMTPELEDMWLPPAGVAHNLVVASLRSDYVGQPERVASFFWGAGQMMFTKYVLTVSAGCGPRDLPSLLSAVARNVLSPARLLFSRGPVDVLDHASPQLGYGGKLLIDAQGAWDGADALRWARREDGISLWVGEVLLLHAVSNLRRGDTPAPESLARYWAAELGELPRCLALCDCEAPLEQPELLLWILLANSSPDRDVALVELEGAFGVVLDARAKLVEHTGRPWPNVVLASEGTRKLVDARWPEYGLGEFLESPSLALKDYRFSEGAEAVFTLKDL